jgi:hypothetical protein
MGVTLSPRKASRGEPRSGDSWIMAAAVARVRGAEGGAPARRVAVHPGKQACVTRAMCDAWRGDHMSHAPTPFRSAQVCGATPFLSAQACGATRSPSAQYTCVPVPARTRCDCRRRSSPARRWARRPLAAAAARTTSAAERVSAFADSMLQGGTRERAGTRTENESLWWEASTTPSSAFLKRARGSWLSGLARHWVYARKSTPPRARGSLHRAVP